jgi:hypothetical protein
LRLLKGVTQEVSKKLKIKVTSLKTTANLMQIKANKSEALKTKQKALKSLSFMYLIRKKASISKERIPL